MANTMSMKRVYRPKDKHGTRFKDGGSTHAKSGKADREKPSRAPAKKGNKGVPTGTTYRKRGS